MLYQHDYVLSPANKIQLLWGRCINVHGRKGKNIPGDLHMEHLNCILKGCTHGQRSNQDDKAVVRVSQALGSLVPVLNNFDQVHKVPDLSGAHNRKNEERDQKLIIAELQVKFSKPFHRDTIKISQLHATFFMGDQRS